MGEGGPRLPMGTFLAAIERHGVEAEEALLEAGWPQWAILTRADKAARGGYTDYGVFVTRAWLTDKGKAWLAVDRSPVAFAPPDHCPDAEDREDEG